MKFNKYFYEGALIMDNIIPIGSDSKSTPLIEDLTKAILIDKEKLAFVKAGLKNIDNLNYKQQVHQEILITIQALKDLLVDVDIKLGEMSKNSPNVRGRVKESCKE